MKKYLKSLLGFPVGVMLLALSYVLVYLVDGETSYLTELGKLTNIRFFISQCLYSGIAYIVVFESIRIFNEFQKDGITGGIVLKAFAEIVVICVSIPLIKAILKAKHTMAGEVGTLLVGTAVLSLIICAIGYMSFQIIENKKINKALKEKNKKEKSEN